MNNKEIDVMNRHDEIPEEGIEWCSYHDNAWERCEQTSSMRCVKVTKLPSIDIEPTWCALLNVAKRCGNPEILEGACKVADLVRQAQKRGESVTIRPDGSYEFRNGYD